MVTRAHLAILSQARRGVAEAQLTLGKMYLCGLPGVAQNPVVALEWLRKAALQGQAEARRLIAETVPLDVLAASSQLIDLAGMVRLQAQAGDGLVQWRYVCLHEAAPAAVEAEHADATLLVRQMLTTVAGTGHAAACWKLSDVQRREGQDAAALTSAGHAAALGHAGAQAWLAQRWVVDHQRAKAQASAARSRSALRPVDLHLQSTACGVAIDQLLTQAPLPAADACGLLLRYFEAHGWTDPRARLALRKAAEAGHAGAAWTLGRLHVDVAHLRQRGADGAPAWQAARRLVEGVPGEAAAGEHVSGARLCDERMGAEGSAARATASEARPRPSLRSAATWLEVAARHGHGDAAFLLGLLYRLAAFSRRDRHCSDAWLERAAGAGQTDALFYLGQQAWRQRAAGVSRQVSALQWMVQAARAGHGLAQAFLDDFCQRRQARCDWPVNTFDDATIDALRTRHPAMAVRLLLGKAFGLKRIEMLLTPWTSADRGDCVLIDLARWTAKHAPCVVPVVNAAQRRLLDWACYRLREIDGGTGNAEGNYRQRLYLFRKLESLARARQGAPRVTAVAPRGLPARVTPLPSPPATPLTTPYWPRPLSVKTAACRSASKSIGTATVVPPRKSGNASMA